MSEVFRATDDELGRSVAVKLLAAGLCSDGDARGRFSREGRAAARLSGAPNTVTVFDVGEWHGRPFIVMEYLPGGSLAERLAGGVLPTREQAVRWLEQAGGALDHAHGRGVVHRDVKPANLLLDGRGEVVVADFGIATATGLASVTLTGTMLGTAGYLAPEQAEGRRATAASDRYSLAVVAYELLTGRRPFARESVAAEALARIREPLPAASSRNPTLPLAVDAVFERALAISAAIRFASCIAFTNELRRALVAQPAPDQATAALQTVAPPRQRRRHSRLRLLIALASIAALGALAAIVLAGRQGKAAAPETFTARITGPTHTVTEPATTTPTVANAPPGSSLITRGEALLKNKQPLAALPLLQQANRELNASGTASEGRADADLAQAIVAVGSCNGVVSLIDRADQLLAPQPQTDHLRTICDGPPGHRSGHQHTNHNAAQD